MINVDMSGLTPLEKNIHNRLIQACKEEDDIKITRAAQICECSVSKISKFVKKLGFVNYKAYSGFLYGKIEPKVATKASTELARVQEFIDNFNDEIVLRFINMIDAHDKIILFGHGPSALFAQYLEYKLKVITQKYVVTATDETLAKSLLDKDSLVLVFSTTGRFASFKELQEVAHERGAQFLMVVEEYNRGLLEDYENVVFLTQSFQDERLKVHEKSRVIFFLFFEEVLLRMVLR